jgi:hypothetical protein
MLSHDHGEVISNPTIQNKVGSLDKCTQEKLQGIVNT